MPARQKLVIRTMIKAGGVVKAHVRHTKTGLVQVAEGHRIGTTRSGKPILHPDAGTFKQRTKGYTQEDHKDALYAHMDASDEQHAIASHSSGMGPGPAHKARDAHYNEARAHHEAVHGGHAQLGQHPGVSDADHAAVLAQASKGANKHPKTGQPVMPAGYHGKLRSLSRQAFENGRPVEPGPNAERPDGAARSSKPAIPGTHPDIAAAGLEAAGLTRARVDLGDDAGADLRAKTAKGGRKPESVDDDEDAVQHVIRGHNGDNTVSFDKQHAGRVATGLKTLAEHHQGEAAKFAPGTRQHRASTMAAAGYDRAAKEAMKHHKEP